MKINNMRYAKDFDPDTRVVENHKFMSALGRVQDIDNENEKLRAILRQQIMTYQVDDQAWDREADADRIMARLIGEYDE